MRTRVVVTLKSGVLDPQGKAIEGALLSLGIAGIASVRQGKIFDIEIEAADPQAALRLACERLLANTVVENYRIEVIDRAVAANPPEDPTESAARSADMASEGHP